VREEVFMHYTEPRKKADSFPNPNEGQKLKPNGAEAEENSLERSDVSDPELDLDKEKVKTYPKSTPPELY
jgi:hypothetical protein